jgi:hypothetical protein
MTERDGKVIKTDEQAELKELLSRRAVENQDALRAALERVPESVRPALQKALEDADVGYGQALDKLK